MSEELNAVLEQRGSRRAEWIKWYISKEDDPKEVHEDTEGDAEEDELHVVLVEVAEEDDGEDSDVDQQVKERRLVEGYDQLQQKDYDR